MEVLGIYGSPRKGGNTDLMLDAFLSGAQAAGANIVRLYVRKLQVQGCLGCGGCDETGTCVVDDGMTEVYPLLLEVPRIVVSSPIYFYSVSGQLKLLIDRSQACYMKHKLEKDSNPAKSHTVRKGFLLCAGATSGKRLFDCTMLTVRYFFDALNMSYAGELCYRKMEEKGAIRGHESALKECFSAGEAFVC